MAAELGTDPTMAGSAQSASRLRPVDLLPPTMVALVIAFWGFALLFAIAFATPAWASGAPSTRLVSCGDESCLLVTGHRESAAADVRINGHVVEVQGKRKWRAQLPVETVRSWAAPFARRIEVSSYDAATQTQTLQKAELPIGLMGHVPDLASLVITLN